MSVLRQNTNCVKDVNPQSENWILIARVVRLWFVSDFKKTKFPFSMEMGDRIHVYYNLMFVLRALGFDIDYLVDVIGILTGVGTEKELNRSGSETKLNVISIEVDGYRMECTLFGNYIDELNAFMSSGELQNVVISVQFAKLKMGVIDETDSTTFILFDRDPSTLINKSYAELFESHDKNADSGVLPKEFDLLIDKVVLFKVGCVKDQSLRFDQSFRVKKELHSQKKRLCNVKDVEHDDSFLPLSQDLFNKFSNEVVDLQSETVDLGIDSVLATEVVAGLQDILLHLRTHSMMISH
ncbi:uncharacterized protein [Phaseolus vulgaris]|uniref:uncharacterized protein n=1 Tax=Phaseolus vulgaris TaxID=3885 RepID=UPI0035CA794B